MKPNKKEKRFYTFTLSWNWLAFSLWNWKKTTWKGKRCLEKPFECMRKELEGQGCSLWMHVFPCLQNDTRDLFQTWDWRLTVCLQKSKKALKGFCFTYFQSVFLENSRPRKKWKYTFSNQHWILLKGRIILVLKAFLYPKFFLSFHDLIIQNI